VITGLAHRTLRTNPRAIVTAWADLQPGDRDLFRELRADPDFFGIVALSRSRGSVESINGRTAALLSELRSPGKLPEPACEFLLRDNGEPLMRLVLDDILQIETESGFLGGCAALALFPELRNDQTPIGPLQRLSEDALRYAGSLRIADPDTLAERLYAYGTEPTNVARTPPLLRSSNLAETLTMSSGELARAIKPVWHGPRHYRPRSWWTFSTRAYRPAPDSLRHKLYVSPAIDVLGRAMAIAIPVLKRCFCTAFKIGGTPLQLLRPDKFVTYFADEPSMRHAASNLAIALKAIPAQGVPFTAAVDDAAIVSWGIDPPADTQPLSWQARDSWRTLVTRRLAWYLVAARDTATPSVTAWEFARTRLRLDGVDTIYWTSHDRWAVQSVFQQAATT
jgi:hypothetical protein